jgi:4-amino-4-deoxy-L-arabinose transferase-like glycosyltransferase
MRSRPVADARPAPQLAPRFFWPLATAAVAAALLMRLVLLDPLPGEIYGDIVIIFDYMVEVLARKWPLQFVLSNGPLYQYAIAPVVLLTGLNYLGLKLASVVVSLLVLLVTYALGRELLNRDLGLLALFVAGVSSWLLIFSRLGNSQILLPLLSGATILFALRAARRRSLLDIVACALFSTLGLYAYPQSFVQPPVFLLLLVCMWLLDAGINREQVTVFALLSALFAIPFALIVLRDWSGFFNGYIGEKRLSGTELLTILPQNVLRGLLAFHVRGDEVFRSNVPRQPQLDAISGALMLAGIVFWLLPAQRRRSVAIFLPFLLLQAPSWLVRYPAQVPSASRTLGVAPLAYILVASGLWWLVQLARGRRSTAALIVVAALLPIAALNGYRYFAQYPPGLPNGNTPFARIVAGYIDTLPASDTVYLVGSQWGQWEQPHARGIFYALRTPRPITHVDPKGAVCEQLATAMPGSVLIWSPFDQELGLRLASCFRITAPQITSDPVGGPVFQTARVQP